MKKFFALTILSISFLFAQSFTAHGRMSHRLLVSCRPFLHSSPSSKCSIMILNSASPIPGVGEDGCKLTSPSKVNSLPAISQAAVFTGIGVSLYLGTLLFVSILEAGEQLFPGFFNTWKLSWPLLGPIFSLAGVTHFSLKNDYVNIYPYKGAWGFWYLPG